MEKNTGNQLSAEGLNLILILRDLEAEVEEELKEACSGKQPQAESRP